MRPELSDLIQQRHYIACYPFLSNKKVRTDFSGDSQSLQRGRGMDFEEVRLYQVGDDVRTVDWRVTARRGELHTKIFREEQERPVLFYVDLSATMHFGTRVAFKSVVAARLCSLLAWSGAQAGDRVGGLIVSGAEHRMVRPQSKQYGVLSLLQQLVELSAFSEKSIPDICREQLLKLYKVVKRGALVFFLTDAYAWDETVWPVLAKIAEKATVRFFHIYDPLEAIAPRPNRYPLTDGIKRIIFNTAEKNICETYQDRFIKRQQQLREHVVQMGGRFIALPTDTDWQTAGKEVLQWNLF